MCARLFPGPDNEKNVYAKPKEFLLNLQPRKSNGQLDEIKFLVVICLWRLS